MIEEETIMIRHGIGLALGLVLFAGSASRAGELDSEFGPPTRTAAVAPERPDLARADVAATPRASELDRESPTQAYRHGFGGFGHRGFGGFGHRGFGFGRGFGGFGYRGFGFGGFGGYRSFGIGLGFGGLGFGGLGFGGYGLGYGLGYGGYGLGYGGFGYPYGFGGYGFGYPGYGYGGFALNIGYGGGCW